MLTSNPSTLPPPPTSPSLLRRTLRVAGPDGQPGPSFTLTLFDSGAPHPTAGHWLAWRLHVHEPGTGRRGRLLFAGADGEPPATLDRPGLEAAARDVLERLTVRPGDVLDGDPTALYTPEQLAYAVRWAGPLRAATRARLGWREGVPFDLRATLEGAYSSRRLGPGAGREHRVALGVLEARGDSKTLARQALAAELAAHCAAEPELVVGERSRDVYALWPHGSQWVVQLVHPRAVDVLGQRVRFSAPSPEAARERFRLLVQSREALPSIPAAPARRRVSTRAVAG